MNYTSIIRKGSRESAGISLHWAPMLSISLHVRIQRGDRGKLQNIGSLSNTGPDLLKYTQLPSQHSMLGHHRPASETPFKWRFAGLPLMAR